jgi:dihydroorotase
VSTGRFGRLDDGSATLTLVGARVIDPDAGTDGIRDLSIRHGRILDVGDAAGERIEARGLVVAPGLCDLHAHLREPGIDGAETIESGARAAARGGFTMICAMPNTDPPLDGPDLLRELVRRASAGACRVRFIGAATAGRAGREPSDIEALVAAGAVGLSDDGAGIATEPVAREVLHRLARTGRPLIEHAEDPEVAQGAVMRAGSTATRLGLAGWPPEAEQRMVDRDVDLAAETGAAVHFTHLSTAGALDLVRAAKSRGIAVTADVTPHHLALTDAWVAGSRRFAWEAPEVEVGALERAYDGTTRVNPPLASREDALALLAAVEDGTVDAIATDHAPHPIHRKLVPFTEAAPGLIGLETALSLGLAAVEAGRLSLHRLLTALSTAPARIIGERRSLAAGEPADLVVFDPSAQWRVEEASLASASNNTPLLGRMLPGVVRMTVAEGRVTYRS